VRTIVVGLGVQGNKRQRFAEGDVVATVDSGKPADFTSVAAVPDEAYSAALVCTPDEPKAEILRHLLGRGKHVLVEKPLWTADDDAIERLETLAAQNGAVCYVAYNHRFEPHFVRLRDLIASGELGRIYRCRMFYGNGTARLVRDSDWRDQGAGVLPDLGSHLLDTAAFWFGQPEATFQLVSCNRFENKAPDHATVVALDGAPQLEFEMTLLSWRNHFTCDVLAQNGSAHIESLCKWGPSTFTHRRRVLPSGRPPEEAVTLVQDDPTWALEYAHFKSLCRSGARSDLSRDRWINRVLRDLGSAAGATP